MKKVLLMFVLFVLGLSSVLAVPVKITADGEAYGHHGNCLGWNSCGSAENCALQACKANGFDTLVSYGDDRPCTQFNNCHLFNDISSLSVDCDWGNWCDVSGVTDIWCDDGSFNSVCRSDLPPQDEEDEEDEDESDGSHATTLIIGTIYDQEGNEVSGASVDIACNEMSDTVESDADGIYSVLYDSEDCDAGDTVYVNAEKSGVGSGSNSGEVCGTDTCPFNVALIDVTIPEFTVIAAGIALIGALGIVLYKRQ